MPDGMTSPESGTPSSIESVRRLGQIGPDGPTPSNMGVYGSAEDKWQEQLKAGNISPTVEETRRTTDLLGNTSGGEDDEHKVEDEFANRSYYRTESKRSRFIETAETPSELFEGLRGLEGMLENGNIPGGLTERYTPPRELSVMHERADDLKATVEDLLKKGRIRKDSYVEATGIGIPSRLKYASYALWVEEKPIYYVQKDGTRRQVDVELVYHYGTPKERERMAKAYERAVTELEARDIIGEHIGLRLNEEVRDSLENLTAYMHSGRMPKFKGDHLVALFNMPDVDELVDNPENHTLGDQVEEAMFLNLVMLNSGNKERMLDFLKRPGAEHLIAKLAKEKNMSYDDWKRKYIGDVDHWEDDAGRLLEDDKRNGVPATWRKEAADGRRGDLTKWSNISAWGGDPGEFGTDKETEFIEETVGGLVGSVEPSWVAATMMRVVGAYASEGYVALPNGKSLLPLGEDRYISGDDTGKFWAYMFNMKEGRKGRKSGLKDMIGKVPDMAMNLFDWLQVKVGDEVDGNGITRDEKRSVWDAWLGTAEQNKRNLLTGETTTEIAPREEYHRLGDLEFNSTGRYSHGTFTIMQWLMGNAERPTGVFIEAMRTNFKMEDFYLENLKAIRKYAGIVFNPVVLTKGSTHLYVDSFTSPPVIQRNYFRNLMSARVKSFSFSTGILPAKERYFNPQTAGLTEIPSPIVVETLINKALEGNPEDEDQLKEFYVDSNVILRKLPFKTVDTDGMTGRATFEPQVGRVTGRKIL